MVRQRRHCAFGVLLHGIGLPRVQCGCGAQVVGEPIVGTLGEKPVEQRIRFRVVACRDQRLGESETRRETVRGGLELPAVPADGIGIGALPEGKISAQAKQDRVVRCDVQRIGQHALASARVVGPQRQPHQINSRIDVVGINAQDGVVGAPCPREIVQAQEGAGPQFVDGGPGILRPVVPRVQLAQQILAPPLLQPQLTQREHQLGGTEPQGLCAFQLLLGVRQIAAGQIDLAEHHSDVGVLGLFLQHALELGDRELRVAPLQERLRVLHALLRRRLIAGADGQQADQTWNEGQTQPRVLTGDVRRPQVGGGWHPVDSDPPAPGCSEPQWPDHPARRRIMTITIKARPVANSSRLAGSGMASGGASTSRSTAGDSSRDTSSPASGF